SLVGEKLSGSNNIVDLENPEVKYKVYRLEDEIVVSKVIEDINRGLFEKRKNQERPFSSPVSLNPVIARALVNIAGLEAGEHILDPFCGTAGILIEAGLCGIGVHGLDMQGEMVEGSRENLEEFGIINHDIREGDVKNIEEIFDLSLFDGVVTDLPYGRASKTSEDFKTAFLDLTDKIDGKTVFMYNEEDFKGLKPEAEIYMHKNLSRYVYII
ncbi:MAG: methyltransferase domain-containing protein, partial [Candidatus Nanohaloarchaea archaeon]